MINNKSRLGGENYLQQSLLITLDILINKTYNLFVCKLRNKEIVESCAERQSFWLQYK